jgi:hypothetical protein
VARRSLEHEVGVDPMGALPQDVEATPVDRRDAVAEDEGAVQAGTSIGAVLAGGVSRRVLRPEVFVVEARNEVAGVGKRGNPLRSL